MVGENFGQGRPCHPNRTSRYTSIMDLGESSSMGSDNLIRDTKIQEGNSVLVKLPNGDLRSVKVDRDACGTNY